LPFSIANNRSGFSHHSYYICSKIKGMKLSHLSETLIGSEIVKLGGEIREKMRQGEKIYNFTVGDFDPSIFPIPKELEDEIVIAYRNHFTNYPAAEGNLDLREAIVSFMKEWEKLDYLIRRDTCFIRWSSAYLCNLPCYL
jgi:aspartate/methionine/tyrosine aminotransferase